MKKIMSILAMILTLLPIVVNTSYASNEKDEKITSIIETADKTKKDTVEQKTTDKVEDKKIKITHKIFYGALSLFSTYISYSYIQSSSCLSTCQSNINQLSKKLAEGWYQKAKKQIPYLPDFREQLFQIDTYRFLEHDLGLCKGFFLHERVLSKIQDIPLIFNSKLHEFYLKLNSIKNTLLGRNSLQLYKSEQ